MAKFGNGRRDDNENENNDKYRVSPPRIQKIVENRCNVCRSVYRDVIDKLLVMGVSYSEIARNFEEEGINRKNIANHHKRHVDVEQRAIREILEEEARRIGEEVEEGKTSIITQNAYMKVALMKSYQAIVDGRILPEPRDVVQMINLMEKQQERTAATQIEEMTREMNAFVRAVQQNVPRELWAVITTDFNRMLDVDQSLIARYGNQMPDINMALPSSSTPQVLDIEIERDDNDSKKDDE